MSRRRSLVGSKVEIDAGGGRRVCGEIVEDRGDIGVRGRKLVRVKVEDGIDEIELPLELLEVIGE